MSSNLLKGQLVQLTAEDAKTLAEPYSRWSRDAEYCRLMTTDIARTYSIYASEKQTERFLEKEPPEGAFYFNIRTLEDDCLIGDIGLDVISWAYGESFVGIGIADRSYWGRGYGTDAMRVILRFAFRELNLRRVSLNTFEYNPRAIRSYEKAGFRLEGCVRRYLHRDGKRWDFIFMGILREDWQRGDSYDASDLQSK